MVLMPFRKVRAALGPALWAAVTVLTSLDGRDLEEIGFAYRAEKDEQSAAKARRCPGGSASIHPRPGIQRSVGSESQLWRRTPLA